MELTRLSAWELGRAIGRGTVSAVEAATAALARISLQQPDINAFTQVLDERALDEARAVDRLRLNGVELPPLAGVPYAVKDLFDLEGVVTVAGSKVLRSQQPASGDATLVRRLKRAGAVCVGALNMDEFAYGFTTENSHHGPTRNPRDRARTAGGSSGGCGAAVAAGMVPLALGSDTNGSIRVPASLCGVFGLKPTFGRLPRGGSYPFVAGLDHLGPFARCVEDLVLAYDAMQGPDESDPYCAQRPAEPVWGRLTDGIQGIRFARLTGYFDEHAGEVAEEASRAAAKALGCSREVTLGGAAMARAAAFVTTASEGGALHLQRLRGSYGDYEPLSRDRFVAGALIPAAWYLQAQRYRGWFREEARRLFEEADVLIAPATPCQAPLLGAEWLEIKGRSFPARASMGLLTQPISFLGLPVVAVPIPQAGGLPIGVQVIAPPWREDLALRAAKFLEETGLAAAPVAELEP
jgi:AtzE family amidohydrolase